MRTAASTMPPALHLVVLLLATMAGACAASDDAAAVRDFLIAHAGSAAAPAPLVPLLGEDHREVSVVAADAQNAHLHGPDIDAMVPWRALDAVALTALASPSIDQADDPTLAAWLRIAATCPARDRRFPERIAQLAPARRRPRRDGGTVTASRIRGTACDHSGCRIRAGTGPRRCRRHARKGRRG